MEQNPSSSIFNLSIDPLAKSHLSETAKWARFLSIVGMISLVLMILFGLFFSRIFSSLSGNSFEGSEVSSEWTAGMGMAMAVVYIIIAIIWFFPFLYLLRFANTIKTAVNSNDQNALNVSFQNLKACFRYVGIVTIIVLALYALIFVFAIVGGAASAF